MREQLQVMLLCAAFGFISACSTQQNPSGEPAAKCKSRCASGAKRDAAALPEDAAVSTQADAVPSQVNTGSTPALDAAAPSGGGSALCTQSGDCEEKVNVGSGIHQTGSIDYPDPPPAGGMHNPCWAKYGVHDEPLAAENWVHNLEHGAVVFLYQCACADERAQLEQFVTAHRRTVLTEYGNMKKRFAVVAWGYRLQTDTLDLPAFESFYAAHYDNGPESIDSDPPSGCPL